MKSFSEKPQLPRDKMKDNKFAQLAGNRILSVEYAKRISRKRPHLHIRHAISRRTWLPAPSRRKNFWEGRNSPRKSIGKEEEESYSILDRISSPYAEWLWCNSFPPPVPSFLLFFNLASKFYITIPDRNYSHSPLESRNRVRKNFLAISK